MSPRRRGRGRGNGGGGSGGAAGAAATGSHGSGPAAGADLAAAPSASTAEIGPLAQEAPTAVDRSTPAVSSTNTTARSGSGFSSNGGPRPGPGRGGNASRGADSRRSPRTNIPSVIAASPQQDAGVLDQPAGQRTSSCTLAQMRRFIKSRPYVPVHELRRRFLIEGLEDEVSPISTGQRTLYVGLPAREAQFLGDLVRGGEVGCETLLDPAGPGVVGVYPMRPVARQ